MELLVAIGFFALFILAVILRSGASARRGKRGEKIVSRRLRSALPEEYQILDDIYLPLPDGSTTQIDHIVISQYGIFVVETKNYSGWIFANEKSAQWTQTIYRAKNTFQNPIRQNYRHICALSSTLQISRNYFTSVVAFTGSCDFRTEMPDGVVYSREAADYIRSFTTPKIKDKQIAAIANAILAWQGTVSEERKADHIRNLKRHHCAVSINDNIPKCPFCGGDMVLRHRKADGKPFYGCKRYPNCRGIVNIR